ncbi:MAG TPA: radical SAM family heme chaperone HemW [Paludibacter sp.]
MAGIYIHIPFCKKRCTYCDFYTEVAPKFIPSLVDAVKKELQIRKDYLQNASINTIYFGGGTPSILKADEFNDIFNTIYELFSVDKDAEITFEANPDDLSVQYLDSIKELPFNRISIGIQSFDDEDLKRINRRHTGVEAIEAVKNAQSAGFDNLSIDLIYGLPLQTLEGWEKQLDIALSLNVQHISSYGLTYEEGTALWKQREKGKVTNVDDETMNAMYLLLLDKVQQKGFEAYEVSNFALPDYRSRHNTSYWKQDPYLGIGPSAHSYDLHSRQWNVASIKEYIKAIENNTPFFEQEELTLNDRYNDYVMVSLRTANGIDLKILEQEFGPELTSYCIENIKSFIDNGKAINEGGKLRLTSAGIMISNLILIELMKV